MGRDSWDSSGDPSRIARPRADDDVWWRDAPERPIRGRGQGGRPSGPPPRAVRGGRSGDGRAGSQRPGRSAAYGDGNGAGRPDRTSWSGRGEAAGDGNGAGRPDRTSPGYGAGNGNGSDRANGARGAGRPQPAGNRDLAPWAARTRGAPSAGTGVADHGRDLRPGDGRRTGWYDEPASGRDPRRVVIGEPVGGRGDGPRHVRRDGDGDDPGNQRKRAWPQRLVLIAGVVIVVCCLLGGSVAGYVLIKYESIDRVGGLDIAPAASGEPQNYLIVAVDTREGQGSKNTDTMMVVRVDPGSDRLAITSFPRDLMVTIADTGETGMINSAFARDSGGEQNLISTLQQNFDITINHYVQVNFDSFRQVVDSIGGVPVWMPTAARDAASGFYNDQLGCVNLEGEQGLAFVRSRKMEILTDDEGWEHDPLSDQNRVLRQQIFIQRAMTDALAEVKSNPLRLRELVDIGVSNVSLDPNLGIGDILDLADHFKDFDASKLETYPLPVVEYPPDPNRLLLDEAGAEPMLNVFRGLAAGEVRPGLVTVKVLNGTVADEAQLREGLATDVSGALQEVGFQMAAPDDAETFYPQTTIEYAPGQQAYAERLARHITSATAIPMVENPELASGTVRLIAGVDFTTVHQEPTPIEAMPVAPGAAPAEPAPSGEAPAEAPASPPETTPTTENPFVIGATPEGATC
jgi:LCP family protein required for cell wall assembly